MLSVINNASAVTLLFVLNRADGKNENGNSVGMGMGMISDGSGTGMGTRKSFPHASSMYVSFVCR